MWQFLRRMALYIATPLTDLISKCHAPFSIKKLTAKDYREIKALAKPGHVLISRVRGEFSNLFIPGTWSHAAFVLDENTVMEATFHGVVKTDLIDFVLKKDYVALLEDKFCTPEQRAKAVVAAYSFEGLPYDKLFDQGVKALYCSELVYEAFQHAFAPAKSPFTKREKLGILTVVPEDFALAKSKFKVLWSNKSQ
jgi:uncharacterized protein YycO